METPETLPPWPSWHHILDRRTSLPQRFSASHAAPRDTEQKYCHNLNRNPDFGDDIILLENR